MIKKEKSKKPLPPRPDGTTLPLRRLGSVNQAIEYSGKGRTKLYEEINAGRIKAYKDGNQTKVDFDSIDELNAALPPLVPREVAA